MLFISTYLPHLTTISGQWINLTDVLSASSIIHTSPDRN